MGQAHPHTRFNPGTRPSSTCGSREGAGAPPQPRCWGGNEGSAHGWGFGPVPEEGEEDGPEAHPREGLGDDPEPDQDGGGQGM